MNARLPLIVLLAGLGTWIVPAAAQTAPETSNVQATFRGTAVGGCRLSTPTSSSVDNVSVGALTPGSADITFNQLVGANSTAVGATVVLVMPAVCNQAHTLSLSSLNGGLLGDGPVTAGPFRSNLPYNVTVSWAGTQQSFTTGGGNLSLPLSNAVADNLTVTIQIPAGGAPLAAGNYADELVLELGAAG
jgi:hypothetical protein